MELFRALRKSLFLSCAAPLLLCAQASTQGDVPRQPPGSQHPDMQQQTSPKKGAGDTQSKDDTAGQSGNADTDQNTQSPKKSKKTHNRQTHGAQKHNPDHQS